MRTIRQHNITINEPIGLHQDGWAYTATAVAGTAYGAVDQAIGLLATAGWDVRSLEAVLESYRGRPGTRAIIRVR